jgi:DNA invertase Pin-like site-specific DNA recombinase
MPKATAILDDAHQLISRRLDELNEERQRLERALAALGGKATGRRPGRPRGSKAKPTANSAPKRRGRRRGGGRADQAVGLIEKSPGITASEVGKKLKIKPNYLYRVLGDLEKEGRLKKDGRQYYPAEAKGV